MFLSKFIAILSLYCKAFSNNFFVHTKQIFTITHLSLLNNQFFRRNFTSDFVHKCIGKEIKILLKIITYNNNNNKFMSVNRKKNSNYLKIHIY